LSVSASQAVANSIEKTEREARISTRHLLVGMPVASNRFASSAAAVTPDEVFQGPTLPETRARTTNQNLRCVVSQNQTAQLARDSRVLVRERLVFANTDEQTAGFIAARYANFDLLNVPWLLKTLVLWIGPALFVLIIAIGFDRLHTDRTMPASLKAIEFSERSPV
jgi:cytochrome c-type biogenesis protein CcmH